MGTLRRVLKLGGKRGREQGVLGLSHFLCHFPLFSCTGFDSRPWKDSEMWLSLFSTVSKRIQPEFLSFSLRHTKISPSSLLFYSHMKRDGYIFRWKKNVNHTSAMPNIVNI